MTPQQAAHLKAFSDALDAADYFQVLQVAHSAAPGDIKRAFYRESRIYHPDRVFHLTNEVAKQHINDLYKRITEAYYVLRDDAKRKKYLVDISGPERAAKLRYTEASEVELKAEAQKQRDDEFGTNPKARPHFKTALQEMANGNWPAAERSLKMAITFEPSNPRFKEKLAEVQVKLEEKRKNEAAGFKIR